MTSITVHEPKSCDMRKIKQVTSALVSVNFSKL